MRKLCEKITDELAGLSVESGLKRCFFMSNDHISRLKRRPEGITLNGKKAYTTATLSAGDMLCAEICDGETVRPTPMDMPLVALYEDEDIIIIDKPAGVAVHSSTRNPEELTLENAFSARLKEGENFHPVSRLDRGTTGIMTIAKNGYMHHRLKRIMHTEKFRREYVGISVGRVEPESGRIELPIGFEQGSRYKRAIQPLGAPALTEYRTLQCNNGFTLLRLIPHTGRTHQLRLHMSAIGYPLAGDWLYGREDRELIARPALHSCELWLTHPLTGDKLHIVSPPPEDMLRLMR